MYVLRSMIFELIKTALSLWIKNSFNILRELIGKHFDE